MRLLCNGSSDEHLLLLIHILELNVQAFSNDFSSLEIFCVELTVVLMVIFRQLNFPVVYPSGYSD